MVKNILVIRNDRFEEFCPDLRLSFFNEGKFGEGAIRFILVGDCVCKNGVKTLPINLSIAGDGKTMRYVYALESGELTCLNFQ